MVPASESETAWIFFAVSVVRSRLSVVVRAGALTVAAEQVASAEKIVDSFTLTVAAVDG